MKTLATYKVVELDSGQIAVYDAFKVNAPQAIAKPIIEYFEKRKQKHG